LESVRPQYVFFLTDGAVSNADGVLDLVAHSKTRISTLGIGNAAPVDLVRGIAELTTGFHEFVDNPEDIAEAVIRSLSDTLTSGLRTTAHSVRCRARVSKHLRFIRPLKLGSVI
jgi:hypothetical protein